MNLNHIFLRTLVVRTERTARAIAVNLVIALTLFCPSSAPADTNTTSADTNTAFLSKERREAGLVPGTLIRADNRAKPDGAQAARQIFLFQVALVGSGFLYGHSPLGWEEPTAEKWSSNISQPPEYPDGDGLLINYVGHPLMGAYMFIFARHQGFDFMQSAGASTLGSFFWEYGLEAPFERPSRSDLLVTSTIGSLIGEAAYHLYKEIDRSPAGSKWYGKVAKMIICPVYIF